MRPRPALLLAVLGLLLVPAAALAATAKPRLWAHRGGSVLAGRPTYPENTLPGFRHAARIGAVVEFDVKLTKDRVPIVIHDDTLDRTTTCTGPVRARTFRFIQRHCRSDVVGSPGSGLPWHHVGARRRVALSTFAQVLREMKRRHATIAPEMKDAPGDGYANRFMNTLRAAHYPRRQVVIQSFFVPNLTVAHERWPGVATSMLTLGAFNAQSQAFAAASHSHWLSPEFPVDRAWVSDAHRKGYAVVPYTLDRRAAVRAAKRIGVDALITDDPFMALRALGRRIPR